MHTIQTQHQPLTQQQTEQQQQQVQPEPELQTQTLAMCKTRAMTPPTRRAPEMTPLRDASIGFGLWPWSRGPLWRLEEAWSFSVVVSGSESGPGPGCGSGGGGGGAPLPRSAPGPGAAPLPPPLRVVFTIPAGYEFDKASVPSFLWGFPFNYTPDGLCTVPALEHDFLCDLHRGGSAWLKGRLGVVPPAPPPAVIHRHFYDRLLEWGVRPSKARAMWVAVRSVGPGGWVWGGG